MLRKWVLTTAGFSSGGASFLALRNFLIKANGLRFNPREYRRRARLCINSTNWSLNRQNAGGEREKIAFKLVDGSTFLRFVNLLLKLWLRLTYFGISRSWSKSTPRKVNLRKARFFFRVSSTYKMEQTNIWQMFAFQLPKIFMIFYLANFTFSTTVSEG